LALFDLLVDDKPVVVVFLPMLDHQNTKSSNMVNPLQNPRTGSIVEKRYSLARMKLAQSVKLKWR